MKANQDGIPKKMKGKNEELAITNALRVAGYEVSVEKGVLKISGEGKISLKALNDMYDNICSDNHPTAAVQKKYSKSPENLAMARANAFNQEVKNVLRTSPVEIKALILSREIPERGQRGEGGKIIPNSFKKKMSAMIWLLEHKISGPKICYLNTAKDMNQSNVDKWIELESGKVYTFSVKQSTSSEADSIRFFADDTSSFKDAGETMDPIEIFLENVGQDPISIAEAVDSEILPEKSTRDDEPLLFCVNVDYSRVGDTKKFKGGIIQVSDYSTDPENTLHKCKIMTTRENAVRYGGAFSRLYAYGKATLEKEGEYPGVTINADYIIPIDAIESEIQEKNNNIPDNAQSAENDYAEYEKVGEESNDDGPKDGDAPEGCEDCYGIGYEEDDSGCQECSGKDRCKALVEEQ